MNQYLIYLICTPDMEEPMVDWLLERPDISGFTSLPARGHGSSSHAMSLAEQVAGRRRQTLFMIQSDEESAYALVEAVREEFSGSGLHYWMLPLAAQGHLE